MARTQAADYAQKREAITENAAKLFARAGFAGASLSELAEACGMSKSLIYHYYPSKEAILYDVMSAHMDALLDAAETATAKGDPVDDLKSLARALMRRYVGGADAQKVLLYEMNWLPKAQREEIVGKQRKLIERAEALAAAAHPAFVRDRGRLRAQIMLFFGMLNWTHTWFRASGPVSRDDLADMAVASTLREKA